MTSPSSRNTRTTYFSINFTESICFFCDKVEQEYLRTVSTLRLDKKRSVSSRAFVLRKDIVET